MAQSEPNYWGIGEELREVEIGFAHWKPADGAAGLAISTKMRAQIRGLKQAARNVQDGISMLQTAEGALNSTHSILQRVHELATQASSGTLSATDHGEIQKEIDEIIREIDHVANTTQF